MAKSVNKVILLGTLGKDPELKYTPQGTPVAKFSMATNSSYKDKQSGEWKEQTEWHNIVAWQRTAEVAAEYLKEGSKCYIEGRLQTRSWDDKESGQKKYMTEIIVNDLVLVGGRQGESSSEAGGRSRGAASGSHFDQRSSGGGHEDNFSQAPANSLEITDEDIPF